MWNLTFKVYLQLWRHSVDEWRLAISNCLNAVQKNVFAMPQWKRYPPCKAHLILTSMFENNQISPDETAASVYDQNKEFRKFNLNVFKCAFNQLRQMNGVGCKYILFSFN